MITVGKLIALLQKFPADAKCHVYEGEVSGVVIRSADYEKQLGIIMVYDREEEDEQVEEDEEGE